MRWNCPHCGVNLAVSDDKLGAGWSFSRCYKCGGFALIRRAEVNLVKVDRAPAGEHIILPEATEEPTALLSEEATQNLARLRRDSAEKAAARAAMTQAQNAIQQTLGGRQQTDFAAIPEPLQPTPPPAPGKRARLLSVAIGMAGVMTIASGAYLYLQGQALWEQARVPMTAENNEVRPAQGYRNIAARGSDAIPAPALGARTVHSEATDQINHSAMAPIRNEDNVPVQPAIKGTTSLIVQPRARNADLHAGPGSLYPIVGMASPSQQYVVTDWNDRWFRVILREEAVKDPANPPKMAWVRTDLVQVVPVSAPVGGNETLAPYP